MKQIKEWRLTACFPGQKPGEHAEPRRSLVRCRAASGAELSLEVGDGANREGRTLVVLLRASISPSKERYAVSNNNVVKLIEPGTFDDQLTEILRTGSRSLLAHAVEAEVADFLANVSRGRV